MYIGFLAFKANWVVYDFFMYFAGEKDSSNLYLSFRWLLVDFKREFQFSDLMILWEVGCMGVVSSY